ncbi:MAG: MurR/RpiR family transcriptional regulator [Pseudomonadota bacterium]
MLHRIEQLKPTLSPAENRVADCILTNPHALTTMRMAELARQAGVSDPTIVRFCKKIGSPGFDALRLAVARHLASDPSDVHASVRDGDSADVVTRKVFASTISELRRVQQSLRPESLDQAAKALLTAHRIVFVGVGASAVVAMDANNKFFRLGLPTAAFTDGPTIVQAGATTATGSCLVAISKSGHSNDVIRATQLAGQRGATTIAVTLPASPLADACDLTLVVDAEEDTAAFTPMGSRIAQLAALDALQLCTALAGGHTTREHLEASKLALR